METIDIYIGAENNDHFDIHDLAALYNVKVISIDQEYATIEGDESDLDQFSEFWSGHILDNSRYMFWQ